MLVVDLMHEFEQGVWKALFIHLLCMLDSKGGSHIHKLDLGYVVYFVIMHLSIAISKVLTSTFRRGTIWKFLSNASAMKRFATNDFEDLLQVGTFQPFPYHAHIHFFSQFW